MKAIAVVLAVLALAAAAATAAPAPSPSHVDVLVGLTPANADRLDALFWQVSDPAHARYGQYLSRDALRELVQPPAAHIDRVTRWLVGHGATHVQLLASGDSLRATVAVDDLEHVLAHRRHDSDVAGLVDAVVPLVPDPHPHSRLQVTGEPGAKWRALRAYKSVAAPRDATGDPNSQKQAYGIPTALVGTQPGHTQMVWGTGTYGYTPSDLQQFYRDWSLPDNTPNLAAAGGFAGTPGGDNFGEATLDVTYISSLALGVQTFVSNTDNSSDTEWSTGFGTAMYAFFTDLAAAQDVPTVLSLSLGSLSWDSCTLLCDQVPSASQGQFTTAQCQQYMTTQRQVCMYPDGAQASRMNYEFQKLGLRGVTLVAASGDGGSHFSFQEFPGDPLGTVLNALSCAYNLPTFPAESPYVVGVGGTQWSSGPTTPVAWTASGGGFSWRFPAPAYQTDAVATYLSRAGNGLPAPASFNATGRAYPDVAALANGVPMVVQGQETEAGGTSASAPEFAGIISLLNDARLAKGLPPLGFVNPRLYAVAAQHPGEAFYDMSVGNSNCGADGYCCPTGFPATVGFDVTTGLGSPLWPGLLKYLGADS